MDGDGSGTTDVGTATAGGVPATTSLASPPLSAASFRSVKRPQPSSIIAILMDNTRVDVRTVVVPVALMSNVEPWH